MAAAVITGVEIGVVRALSLRVEVSPGAREQVFRGRGPIMGGKEVVRGRGPLMRGQEVVRRGRVIHEVVRTWRRTEPGRPRQEVRVAVHLK